MGQYDLGVGWTHGRERRSRVEDRRVSRTEAPTERLPRGTAAVDGRPLEDGAGAPLVLARYRLRARLGAGAFGTVWLAHDERLARDVAVKAIAAEHVATGRAEREARAAARLSHPAIVTLYEAGSDGEAMYLVSELVRGGTLAELLADGALSDRDVAEIGLALCQALAHAHAQGVVHRDVKPSNVLVPEAALAGGPAAKLTDFGVARVVGAAAADVLTHTGDVVGTLAYMAPEQAEGREAGPPADLYAAALVLYEGFSGVNPVRGGSAVATARRLGATLPPLQRQRRDLPPSLGAALDRALLPRVGDRGTIADLHRALKAALPALADEPGTVATPRIERVATAMTHVADRGRAGWRHRSREQELAEVAAELEAAGDWTLADRRGVPPGRPMAGDRHGVSPRRRRAPAPLLLGHVAPGLAAGGLVALGLTTLAPLPPAPPLLVGALAAAVVGLLPRLGWLIAAAVLLAWLAGDVGRTGAALLLACGLVACPLLLPFAGRAWSVPFAAPLLGAALLAGAYPALAGQARTLWRRAALGAIGFWLLALAEPLAHATLFYGRARGTLPPGAWERSLDGTAAHALGPLLRSGTLACAGLWAAGAAVLPWLVRGRGAALDLVTATVWAAALAAGASAIGHALHGSVPQPDPRGAALGAAVAVLLAVAARALRPASEPGSAGAAVA
jgi:tRNA A-37 threonylcarbamoyl transferase component Bud32